MRPFLVENGHLRPLILSCITLLASQPVANRKYARTQDKVSDCIIVRHRPRQTTLGQQLHATHRKGVYVNLRGQPTLAGHQFRSLPP